MVELTTTTRIDEQGRLYLAKPVREALGIDGDAAMVELDVRPVDVEEEAGDA